MNIFNNTYIYFTYPNNIYLYKFQRFIYKILFITKIIFIKHDWNILIIKIYQDLY